MTGRSTAADSRMGVKYRGCAEKWAKKLAFYISFHPSEIFLHTYTESPQLLAVLHGQGVNTVIRASSLACMNPDASLAWDNLVKWLSGFWAVHQLLLPSHKAVSLYDGSVISRWSQKLSPPKWVWSADCPVPQHPLLGENMLITWILLTPSSGADCWAEPVPGEWAPIASPHHFKLIRDRMRIPSPLRKSSFSRVRKALLDKRRWWGEAEPVQASQALSSAFSLLIWMILVRSSLKWGKFNCAAYFLT